MSKTTTTTPPDLDEQIAELRERIYNLDQQLLALEAQKAKQENYMRWADSDDGFKAWRRQQRRQEERMR